MLWGVLLMAVAALMLLRGTLPDGLGDIATRAWPALLVMIGLAFLLRGRVPLSDSLALVLSVALVGGVAFAAYSTRAAQQRDDQQLTISQEIDNAVTLLAVNVNTLNTDVEIISTPEDAIIGGQFVGSTESDIQIDYIERDDGGAEFTLTETQSEQFPMLDAVGRGTLRLELPRDVAVVIAFRGEDGDATLNLSDLNVERLGFTLASGDALITFPEYEPRSPNALEEPGQLVVENGDIVLFVPETAAARLELNRGSTRPEFDDSYVLIDDGADGTLEKRTINDDDIPLYYEVTAPRGVIELQVRASE
ncbi:MAG: hypothetical protein OHK0046_37360 [Anaerolineae bacterium]